MKHERGIFRGLAESRDAVLSWPARVCAALLALAAVAAWLLAWALLP